MRRKRNIIILIFSLAVVIGVSVILDNSYIHEANKNMDMGGFKLLSKEEQVKDLLDERFILVGGFGCNPYDNSHDGTKIVFSGFPDVLDDYKLTSITVTNPKYHFYGIHAGDNIDIAFEIMSKEGFKKKDADCKRGDICFKKRKLLVYFETDNMNNITSITIDLESTNKKNVVF